MDGLMMQTFEFYAIIIFWIIAGKALIHGFMIRGFHDNVVEYKNNDIKKHSNSMFHIIEQIMSASIFIYLSAIYSGTTSNSFFMLLAFAVSVRILIRDLIINYVRFETMRMNVSCNNPIWDLHDCLVAKMIAVHQLVYYAYIITQFVIVNILIIKGF